MSFGERVEQERPGRIAVKKHSPRRRLEKTRKGKARKAWTSEQGATLKANKLGRDKEETRNARNVLIPPLDDGIELQCRARSV